VKTQIVRVKAEKKGKVFLQCDNARPHTSILTRETTADIQVDSSQHLPYSIYLAL
jgi:hypothetical protein